MPNHTRRIARTILWTAALVALPRFTSAQAVDTPSARPGHAETIASIRTGYLDAVGRHTAAALPIGVFDSGTGGLAVLEEILRLDQFDNATHRPRRGGDGRPDFAAEQFVFLADQANMPYGNYPAAGRRAFLAELVVADAIFLLDTGYHADARAARRSRDKTPVKAIAIACNTATAHGKPTIERLLNLAEIDVRLADVISAGAEGAVEALASSRGTIGVVATQGTVDSAAYPAALQAVAQRRGLPPLRVVQQGSLGLAGAIDGLSDYLLPDATSARPRREYRGPELNHPGAPIDSRILPRYGFDFSACRMLREGDPTRPTALEINSLENYVAYEVTSLLEKLRVQSDAPPLAAVVLGCTHFPYCASSFRDQLRRLYDYQEDGQYVYRARMAPDVRLVDPAEYLARQLYVSLAADHKLRVRGDEGVSVPRAQFYITVPNPDHPAVRLDAQGAFTYEYKYSRSGPLPVDDFRTVPLVPSRLEPAVARRLERQLPRVWKLLRDYSESREKSASVPR